MSPFQLAKHHATIYCHRKHLSLSKAPLVIGTTSCQDYPFCGTTSCYQKHLLLSGPSLVIETTYCYRKHLLPLKGIFVGLGTSYLGPSHWHCHCLLAWPAWPSPNDYANIWLHKHKILARQERRPHLKSRLMETLRRQLHATSGIPYTILYLPSMNCFSFLDSSSRQHAITSAFRNSLTCSSIEASLKGCKGLPMPSR